MGLSHTRHYLSGEEGAALPAYLVGTPGESDPDCITVLQFESQESMGRSLQATQDPDIAPKMQADEEKFMDRSRTKIVAVGDAMVTTRD